MSDIDILSTSSEYTSSSEFDLVKRVQITNEVPPTSLWALLPTGLHSDFWRYFIGTMDIAYDVPLETSIADPTINDKIMKLVNGVRSTVYGPTDGTNYHSMSIDGVILPEIDLFLHEAYRYLDHFYPDHPDYDQLLTPAELNDAFYAAAAIIGYTPDYRFLEKWSQSITGTSMTREELKWKIRDLRTAAFRRKFFGTYLGYKLIFSSIYRHGSIYCTGTYLPKTEGGDIDVTNKNLFRRFRLIDFLGEGTESYKQSSQVSFSGLVDPSDLLHIYETTPQSILVADTSSLPRVNTGAFVYDENYELIANGKIVVQTQDTVPVGAINYISHYFKVSNILKPSVRSYNIIRNGDMLETPVELTPRPFGNADDNTDVTLGRFSLPITTAIGIYPSDISPLTNTSSISFGGTTFNEDDTIQDTYRTNEVYLARDYVIVTDVVPGGMIIDINPNQSPVMMSTPSTSVLNGAVDVQIPTYEDNGSVTYNSIFLEGTLSFDINSLIKPTRAVFNLMNIPDTHPITSSTGNREALILSSEDSTCSVNVGYTVKFYVYSEEALEWVEIPSTIGWIRSFDLGYVKTLELSRDGELLPGAVIGDPTNAEAFTLDSFTTWKNRASYNFYADVSISSETATITGSISSTTPTHITVIGGSEQQRKAERFSPGDIIRGPGIPEGTVLTYSSAEYLVISQDATRFGDYEYSLTLKQGYTVEEPQILSFKNTLYSRYSDLSTSAFSFLWPSDIWPNVSLGYLEGIRDTSSYSYPTTLPSTVVTPASVLFEKIFYLDLSLDRLLYHANSLELKTSGSYLCLCDTPWLDYIDSFVQSAKRATENVRIGTQLNLTTDTSGMYSIVPGNLYSDTNIQSRFIVIPQTYNVDSTPSYIQLGTGGSERETLFVSVDDLIRPSIYGSAVYDSGQDQSINSIRRSIYLQNTGTSSSAIITGTVAEETPTRIDLVEGIELLSSFTVGDTIQGPGIPGSTTISFVSPAFTDSGDPIAERYVEISQNAIQFGTYQYVLTSGALDPGTTTLQLESPIFEEPVGEYEDLRDLKSTATSTNTFHTIHNVVESKQFIDLTIELSGTDSLIVNSPSFTETKLAEIWLYKGTWVPSTVPDHPTTPNWPDADAVDDYYIVTQTTTIGTYVFTKGDWIVWDGSSWTIRTWVLQNWLTGATITLPEFSSINVPEGSTLEEIISLQFPYFILSENCTIPELGETANAGDWLILTSIVFSGEVPVSGTWVIGNGKCYDALVSPISRQAVSTGAYTTSVNRRIEFIEDAITTYNLPRRFLAKGSCNFRVRVDPLFTAYDLDDVEYNLTESPIYYDSDVDLFYVLNSDVKHYVKFKEPQYFKNLGVFTGLINSTAPTVINGIDGLDFAVSKLSLKDSVVTGLQVQVRNSYDSIYENKYFNHYVSLSGMPDNGDRHTLNPITGTEIDSTYASAFQAACSSLDVGSTVHISTPATVRQYDATYENVYYKNLLAVAGVVNKDSPTLLRPAGSSDDDIRSFTDALKLIAAGNTVVSAHILGGSTFISTVNSLPIASILTAENNQTTPTLWLIGGADEDGYGALLKSTDGVIWVSVSLPAGWGTSVITKILFVVNSSGEGEWRIVGEDGKCMYSLDNTATWIVDPLSGSGWGSVNISSLAYEVGAAEGDPGTWVIGGSNGQVAYFVEGSGTWVMSTLPGASGEPISLPPDAPGSIPPGTAGVPVGWETEPVRAVANNNGVWYIGGGSNTPETDVAALLARSTDLAPAEGDTWTFVYLGSDWGDNYVSDIEATDGLTIAVGTGGAIAYSQNDGVSWAPGSLPEDWGTSTIHDINYKYGVWTIVGEAGKVATSVDGLNWEMGSTALGASTLRASAHGLSSTSTIEHLLVGDSNTVAYSNSITESFEAVTVTSTTSSTSLAVEFDSDLVTWSESDVSLSKAVLLTINTSKSVECELIGIPTARIPQFIQNNNLVLPTVVEVDSYMQANRVYYPHLDPEFDLVPHVEGLTDEQIRALAGYPLYSEDSTAYYKNANNAPTTYVNSTQNTIYLCNATGNYVTQDYEQILTTSFVRTSANEDGIITTQFVDSREASYYPRYEYYRDWIEDREGALVYGENIEYSGVVTYVDDNTVIFDTEIPSLGDYNAIQFSILPLEAVTEQTTVDTEPVFTTSPQIDLPITGVYFPIGGYGTWMGYTEDLYETLPWVADPSAFETSGTLTNSYGKPVYLCDEDGEFVLSSGSRIPVRTPLYLSFEDLVAETRIIEKNDLTNVEDLYVTSTDTVNNTFTLSGQPISFAEGELEKRIQIRLLTLATFEPNQEDMNDSRNIYRLDRSEIQKYTEDRIYDGESAYPSVEDNPDIYEAGDFVNNNGYAVHKCDENGNYIDSEETITTDLTTRVQPRLPLYLYCQDWYKNTRWIEGQEDNPYWQYIVIKDTLNMKSKAWEQEGFIADMQVVLPFKDELSLVRIQDNSQYISIQPGLVYQSLNYNFRVETSDYIRYKDGQLVMLLMGNSLYNKDENPNVDLDFEKYGIAFTSHFDNTVFSHTEIIQRDFPGILTSSYYVNTTQNFADTKDRKSSIVAITEMGVFNANDEMIAYATFPPVIYDSSKHHLSLNLFIKDTEFASV